MSLIREEQGRRLLPHLVDELAVDEPDRILYEFPSSTDLKQPWIKITARQFVNAINRAARWIEDTLGRGVDTPRLGYSGPQDLRYFIFVIAAVKSGYVMLYTSPRNSIEGDVAVIEAAGCKTWLLPSRGSNIHRVLEHIDLKLVDTPDLEFFLDPTTAPHYEYPRTWETGKRDLVWVLHTSGSTGHPKPVFRYLDGIASVDANNLLPNIDGLRISLHEFWHSRAYVTFPFFHAAGLNNGLLWPLCHGATVIFGPELPVNLELMKSVIRHAKPDTMFTAPSLVEEVSKDSEFLTLLETVKAIGWGGGPVSREAGARIWKHTKLRLSMGLTEAGWLPCLETDPEDWYYVHMHPWTGYQFQDRGAGLYELVAVRDPKLEKWQPIFSTFPDLQEYAFKDLFSKHPSKPDLYLYEGRIDNVIVLSNGEKVQPNSMELTIGAHPLVSTAVVAGQGRFQTSLLLEVQDNLYPRSEEERRKLVDRIWPAIEEANGPAPAHAKLHRDFVFFASPEKPLIKTSKGTVRRGPTLQLYQEELDQIYGQDILDGSGDDLPGLDLSGVEELSSSLRSLVAQLASASTLGDDDDFFAVAGLDSLQVLTLRKEIIRAVHKQKTQDLTSLSTAIVYRNPTLRQLSRTLWALISPVNGTESPNGIEESAAAKLLDRYTGTLPSSTNVPIRSRQPAGDRKVVILTGSTGRLGSYILHELIEAPGVDEIWCLNRSADAEARQTELNIKRGLNTGFGKNKVNFRRANLTETTLGLSVADHGYLLENATHIIHTQWQVDFNLSVTSFEPHVHGIRKLVTFAAEAPSRPKIFFTSSVGVATNFPPSQGGAVPEKRISDLAIAGLGYGESKLIAESILLEAAEQSGVSVTVCRVGQIAGPVKYGHQGGEWNRKEWFPSIIDASAYLSKIPDTLGKNEWIDWIPVDHLSSIILELAGINDSKTTTTPDATSQIVHAVNPKRVRWVELLPSVRERLETKTNSKEIEVVSLEQWVEELKRAASRVGDKEQAALSAFKLIPFLTGLSADGQRPEFETKFSERHSSTLRDLEAVSPQWLDAWISQWGL